MSIIQGLNLDNGANFNSSGIEFDGVLANLLKINNTGQSFSQDFASSAGFTYDNTKAEFTGGLVRQKDQRPTNAILGATYTSSKNASWDSAGSSLTATDTGAPVLNGGYLDCLGYLNVGVSYTNTSLAVVTNNGSIKFKYKPNYSNAPSISVGLCELGNPAGGNTNRIVVSHSASTGYITMVIYNSAGTLIGTTNSSAFLPVGGTTYEIEIGWATDSPNRYTYIFLNGVAIGGNTISSMTRTNTATKLRIGASSTVTNQAHGSFDDVVVFNTTQNIVGYTPGYTLQEYVFLASNVILPAFVYPNVGLIQALSNLTVTEVGAPKYITAGKYWNGVSWMTSDMTPAQSNPLSTIVANIVAHPILGASSVVMTIVYSDSNTLSSCDNLTLTYTGQKYSTLGWIEPLQGVSAEEFLSTNQLYTETANSFLKVAIKVNGVLKYWNGSAWVTSNGTTQSNTFAEINANFATLTFSSNSTVVFRFIMTSSNNDETATITWADIEYNFGAVATSPNTCLVHSYLKDISGVPIAGATVVVKLVKDSGDYKEASNNIIEKSVSTITDAFGYFQLSLIWSSEYDTPALYNIAISKESIGLSITKTSDGEPLNFLVPDLQTKDITEYFLG